MIVIQEEVPLKRFNLCSRGRPLHREKKEEISGIGSELKLSVDAGLERLNVICSQNDGRRSKLIFCHAISSSQRKCQKGHNIGV